MPVNPDDRVRAEPVRDVYSVTRVNREVRVQVERGRSGSGCARVQTASGASCAVWRGSPVAVGARFSRLSVSPPGAFRPRGFPPLAGGGGGGARRAAAGAVKRGANRGT